MTENVLREVLAKVYDIALRTRLLGEWTKIHKAKRTDYSERQLFVLELIHGFPPITNSKLSTIFGLSASSVSEMVKRLMEDGLVEAERDRDRATRDGREKPLRLTTEGQEYLTELKQSGSARFDYLFKGIEPAKWRELLPLLCDIDQAAEAQVQDTIFRR